MWHQMQIGPLKETPRGSKYIMTVTDYFSKWAEAEPLNDKSATSVGYVNLVDWNGGMEWWSGLLEWSTGLDYWSATPTSRYNLALSVIA